MAQVILLGTGTGLPDADRENTHLLWNGLGGPLLIDAGGSTYQRLLRAGVDPQALTGVVLTHSHPDHINGLPVLLFSMGLAGRKEPLPIYGLEPTLAMAEALCTAMELDYSFVVVPQWQPIQAGVRLPLATGWLLETAPTQHSRPCIALAFRGPAGRAVCYSADTEPCPAVAALAQGARLLIHEATTPDPFPGHTSPRQAGAIAAAAGVERLILVHYSPHYTMAEALALDEVQAGGFDGVAEIGRDGQVIEV